MQAPETSDDAPDWSAIRKARWRDMSAFAAVSLILVAIVACLALLVNDARQTQEDRLRIKTTIEQIQVNQAGIGYLVKQIRSCTDPDGECYKESQAGSAVIVQNLVDAINNRPVQPEVRTALLELCNANNLPCASLRSSG